MRRVSTMQEEAASSKVREGRVDELDVLKAHKKMNNKLKQNSYKLYFNLNFEY